MKQQEATSINKYFTPQTGSLLIIILTLLTLKLNMGFLSSALKTEPPNVVYESEKTVEVSLMKRRPGCTGMFWRPDPTLTKKLENNNNWPRDGAKLKGKVVTVNGAKWLLASYVMNVGKDWVKAPEGAAMPFEYDNHYYLELRNSDVQSA
jgi:hypothetical protein